MQKFFKSDFRLYDLYDEVHCKKSSAKAYREHLMEKSPWGPSNEIRSLI
jgi:hypothetical protein